MLNSNPYSPKSMSEFIPLLDSIEEEQALLDNTRNEGCIGIGRKIGSRSTPIKHQNNSECYGNYGDDYFSCQIGEDTSLYQSAIITSTSPGIEEFAITISQSATVSVQCDLGPAVLPKIQEISSITERFTRTIATLMTISPRISSMFKNLMTAVRGWFTSMRSVSTPCECTDRLQDLESKVKLMAVELERYRDIDMELQKVRNLVSNMALSQLKVQEAPPKFQMVIHPPVAVAAAVGAPPPPPPPPPPPLPPPMPNALTVGNRLIINKTPKVGKGEEQANPRLAITDKDLASVKLKKVTRSEKKDVVKTDAVVTLEQLRSVKLRSRRRPVPPQSPNRTPLGRDRMKKLRSPSVRPERRPRIDRIPLSKILSLEDSP